MPPRESRPLSGGAALGARGAAHARGPEEADAGAAEHGGAAEESAQAGDEAAGQHAGRGEEDTTQFTSEIRCSFGTWAL